VRIDEGTMFVCIYVRRRWNTTGSFFFLGKIRPDHAADPDQLGG
jgi:hypothetical protein